MKANNPHIKKLPEAPGVYFFLGAQKKLLYIGKATSLRNRVKSYFSGNIGKTRSAAILKMISETKYIEYQQTDSVLEALILEASLIKTNRPTYNVREKDDKSYNYLVITREDYPRVLVVRGRELDHKFKTQEIKHVFGPFPQGGLLKEAVRIVRKIFSFRDTCSPVDKINIKQKNKLCFNAQIGLCPGVCVGAISKREYNKTIKHIKLFFEGKKKKLIVQLERDMKSYAKNQKFEKANIVKRQLFALRHINDVTLLKREVRELSRSEGVYRIERYDVAHTSGKNIVGAMVVIENGELKKSDYRKFKVRSVLKADDIASLREILRRRFMHEEWRLPDMIVVDGGKAQISAAKNILKEFDYAIPIVSVVKDERHRPREILGNKKNSKKHEDSILQANSEAHRFAIGYHRRGRDQILKK